MRWSDAVRLGIVLIAYLTLGTLYALYTPAWQSPDEPAHYNYVRHVAETGQLPVLHPGDYPHAYLEEIKAARFPPTMSIAPLRYESWQPPLYYLLAAPVYRATQGSLLALRLFSLLLGAGVIGLAYAVARSVQPRQPGVATGVAAFIAGVPMHLAVSASVNNDVLAELLIALVAWQVLRQTGAASQQPESRRSAPGNAGTPTDVRRSPDARHALFLGLLLGLGLVTKLTVYYTALPLALLGLWWQRRQLRTLIRPAALMLVTAWLIVLPWLARNVTLYGWPDIFGTINHAAVVVGQLRTADYIADVGWVAYLAHFATTTFRSFWGQFGWMAVPMDGRIYQGLVVLSALAAAGVIVRWRSAPHPAGTAGAPHPAGTAGAPHPPGTAGAPHPPGTAGAPQAPGTAGAPHPAGTAGAPHPAGTAGAPQPPGTAGAPHPPGTAGAPQPPGTAGAPHPAGTAGAPQPPGTAGAPHPPGTAGAPHPPGTAGAPHPPAPSPLRGEGEIAPLQSVARGLGSEVALDSGAVSVVPAPSEAAVGRPVRLLVGLWLGLAVAGYFTYNVGFVQFQGRYLFPGLIPIALLAVNGWREILARPRWWLAAAVVGGMTALARVGGSPGRWTLACGSAMVAALIVRRWLPPAWDAWLWGLPLIGLTALSGYALFAIVVPNL